MEKKFCLLNLNSEHIKFIYIQLNFYFINELLYTIFLKMFFFKFTKNIPKNCFKLYDNF